MLRGPCQRDEAQASEQQAEGGLQRLGRIQPTAIEPTPKHAEDRRQQHDEQRAEVGEGPCGLRQHEHVAQQEHQHRSRGQAEQQLRRSRIGVSIGQRRREHERRGRKQQRDNRPRRIAKEECDVAGDVRGPHNLRLQLHQRRHHVLGQHAIGERDPRAVGLLVQGEEHQAHRDQGDQRNHLMPLHRGALGRDEPEEPHKDHEHHDDHQRQG